MQHYLGIDGGATRTFAAVVDESGGLLGEWSAEGSLNFYAANDAAVRRHLAEVWQCAQARLPEGAAIQGVVIGCAAVLENATPEESNRLCRGVLPIDEVLVASDCLTALYGACQGAEGVLAIAGTGSVIVARDGAGAFHRVGGWGHRFGDQGSAYWIGIQALARAARIHDLSGNDPLLDLICRWLGVSCLPDALPVLYGADMDKARIAGLGEFLFQEAQDSESVQGLFQEAGEQLAEQVRLVMGLGQLQSGTEVPLFLSGSVLKKNPVVGTALMSGLEHVNVVAREPVDPPHVGAARWARERFLG